MRQKPSLWTILTVVLVSVSVLQLVALQIESGWITLVLALLTLIPQNWPARRHFGLLIGAVASLAITPINTDLSVSHSIVMILGTFTPILVIYLVLEKKFKDGVVAFRFHHGRKWYRKEVAYIVFTAAIAYLILPIYFSLTGQHVNWDVVLKPDHLMSLFLALMLTGIWDELFFIATILGIYRHYLPFWWANITQAIIFSSFLYELGFRSWGFLVAFTFALIQGYVFQRTNSLLYAITIHLVFDVVLFFALIHAHYPQALPIFITG